MARITIEQSPLTSFLDELPKLILQYQQMQLQDRERRESNQVKIIEHLINVNDTRNNKLQSEIDQNIKSYEGATGSIYKLDDSNSTGKALTVLDDLTGNVIEDLSTIAQEYINRGNELRQTKTAIKSDIQQVSLVQDFYKGLGHDYTGGIDPKKWDEGDFSDAEFKAYMNQFPELKDVEAQPFFDAIQRKEQAGLDLKIQALNKLISDENIREMKEERYEQILDKGADADKTNKVVVKKADDWYRQKLHNMDIRNGVKEAQQLGLLAIDPEGMYGGIQDTEQNPDFASYLDAKGSVIKNLAILLGAQPSGELYNEYTRMLNEAEGTVQGGKYSKGDFTSYHNFVDKAYKNYLKLGKSESIEMIAQNIFGFSVSFDQFYTTEQEQFQNQLLVPLEESGHIETNTVEDLSNELDWDDILKDENE